MLIEGTDKGEEINGTGGNDKIYGYGGNDKLIGHPGNDYIDGGDGIDVIFGGQNIDTLKGGKGDDRFAFNSLLAIDADHILDFKPNADRLVFDHHIFDEYRSKGQVSGDDFVSGKQAHDGSDHFLYDHSTGKLFYDADGSGDGDKVLITTLDNKADLHASDLFIF